MGIQRIYCTILAIIIYVITYINKTEAQEIKTFSLKGAFASEQNAKFDDVTIQLLKSTNNALVKLEFADAEGRFTFDKIPQGNYLLVTQSLAFSKYQSDTIKLVKDTDLGLIKLKSITNNLKEVTVTATQSFIQQQYDKTVINVGSSITSVGSTALEVLQKAPGITIDQNDNIAMRGKQGVIVMIDGKLTQMSGADLANMLKSMSASQIDKIDLVTNPSAKYDAAGNAGIIDIKLKKGKNNGTNGSLSLSTGQGRYSKLNPSFNFNHKTKAVNVFGSYNYGLNENFGALDIFRNFYTTDKQFTNANNYNNYFKFNFNNHNARIGSDFNIGKNIVLGFMANGVYSNGDISSNSLAKSYDAQFQNTGSFNTNGFNTPHRSNTSFNINYKQSLDTAGKELTADLDYATFNSNEIQNYLTSYFDSNSNPSQSPYRLKGDLAGDLSIKSFKIDYQQPIKSLGAKFEAGVKSSWVTSDNDVKFFNQSSGTDVLDEGKSNHFIYKENINAAYVNTSKSWKKLSLQLGLRLENTIADGLQIIDQQNFKRNYTQLFPSGYVGYQFNDKNDVGISLSRRIDRPSYRQLNPFKVFLDPLTYASGNPFLNPQLTNSFEFSYTYDKKYSAKLGYSHTNKYILSVLSPDTNPGTVIQTDRNLAEFDYFNLSLGVPVSVGKWLNSNINALMFFGNYSGNLANTNINTGKLTFNFNANNSILITKDLSAEVNAFYNTRSIYGFLDMRDMWSVSLGVQKQLLNKKASLKLNVNDIFYSEKFKGITSLSGYGERFFQSRDSRVGTLSFTYRFGKSNGQRNNRRTGGAEEEKQRAN
ncbi:TonB-dependent receptor family protein [Pelobium sp.]|nr:outer membrane beta-barrel family protein [Pelobium sp.]MDA9554913.1 TonB-dependent receptor family protein [Pelobium sp.]